MNHQASYNNWPVTKEFLESLEMDDLLKAADEAEKHHPISDPHVNELLKMIARIGSTAADSDEKKSYLLMQLKCAMIFHGCPIIFLTLNPAECHSPIALFYTGEKIDLENFDPGLHSSEDRLKRMVDNPLAVVEYFHSMITTIIEKVLKRGVFGERTHHFGTIEYQGRCTPHIHLAVCPLAHRYMR
jgi:Helitron helicase-like domain at N-terminus